MRKKYIGIDNGVSGSIGLLYAGQVEFVKVPVIKELDYHKEKKNITRIDVNKLYYILSVPSYDTWECLVAIERPMVNPGRWTATSSALRCHEATLITLQLLGLPYIFLDSKEWQKEFFPKDCKGDDLKKASLEIGLKLFPGTSDVSHSDRDGLLIAEYCRRRDL